MIRSYLPGCKDMDFFDENPLFMTTNLNMAMTAQERIEQIVAKGTSVKLPTFVPKDLNGNAADPDANWPAPSDFPESPEDRQAYKEKTEAENEAYLKLVNSFRQKLIGEDELALTVATTKLPDVEAKVCHCCGRAL